MITEFDLSSVPGKQVGENNPSSQDDQLQDDQLDFTPEQYLKFAQARRVKFIQGVEKAVESDEGLATLDPDRQANYLAALRDIEKQVLTIRKMEQDKENNDQSNAAIAALILEQARNRNVALSRGHSTVNINIEEIPQKPLIAGETVIGDQIENYREYKQRTGQHESLDPDTHP